MEYMCKPCNPQEQIHLESNINTISRILNWQHKFSLDLSVSVVQTVGSLKTVKLKKI